MGFVTGTALAINWPEADLDDDPSAAAPPRHENAPTPDRSRSGQHECGRNMRVAPSARRRLKVSQVVHEVTTLETTDHEDHTFNGIMFDVTVPTVLPIDFVRITSVSVRGSLGPMSVFVSSSPTDAGYRSIFHDPDKWTRIFSKDVGPSPSACVDLPFDGPLLLRPGETRAIYVHSGRPGDTGIVYDNSHRKEAANNDRLIVQRHGMAHLNSVPFVPHAPWGWGNGWRRNREFVGKVSYGVRWTLWNPETHRVFPARFREAIFIVMAGAYRPESPLYWLPPEMLFYIVNFINFDAFGVQKPKTAKAGAGAFLDRFRGRPLPQPPQANAEVEAPPRRPSLFSRLFSRRRAAPAQPVEPAPDSEDVEVTPVVAAAQSRCEGESSAVLPNRADPDGEARCEGIEEDEDKAHDSAHAEATSKPEDDSTTIHDPSPEEMEGATFVVSNETGTSGC